MNKSQNKSAQNPSIAAPKTITNLHLAFAELAFSWGMVGRFPDGASLVCLEMDCKKLAAMSKELRHQAGYKCEVDDEPQ